eukprot:gene1005-9911_t
MPLNETAHSSSRDVKLITTSKLNHSEEKRSKLDDEQKSLLTTSFFIQVVIFIIFITILLVNAIVVLGLIGAGIPLIIIGVKPSRRYQVISRYNSAAITWRISTIVKWNSCSFNINSTTLSLDNTVDNVDSLNPLPNESIEKYKNQRYKSSTFKFYDETTFENDKTINLDISYSSPLGILAKKSLNVKQFHTKIESLTNQECEKQNGDFQNGKCNFYYKLSKVCFTYSIETGKFGGCKKTIFDIAYPGEYTLTTNGSIPSQTGNMIAREESDPFLLLYSLTGGTLTLAYPDSTLYGTGIGLMVAAFVFSTVFLVAIIIIVVIIRKIVKSIKTHLEYG